MNEAQNLWQWGVTKAAILKCDLSRVFICWKGVFMVITLYMNTNMFSYIRLLIFSYDHSYFKVWGVIEKTFDRANK